MHYSVDTLYGNVIIQQMRVALGDLGKKQVSMSKPKLTVLEGGYGRKLHSGYHFIEARATNTRMMGVVGIHVVWKKSEDRMIHELYHLDFESYGIDGYESHVNPNDSYVEYRVKKMMGGLGGMFVPLDARSVRILLQSAVHVAPECLGEYPEVEEAFPQINRDKFYGNEEYDTLCRLLMPECGVYAIIHYFMMRSIGLDWEGRRTFWMNSADNALFRNPIGMSNTLIRESVDETGQGTYRTASLIDAASGYEMLVSEVSVAKGEDGFYKIIRAEQIKRMRISSIEAALMLKKKEYLSVYSVLEDGFEVDLEKAYPEMMVNEHEAGILYTRFKADNDHVEHKTFYLSEDILGVYYLTDEDQLVVSSFFEEELTRLEHELEHWVKEEALAPVGQFVIDVPILYDFVNSGFGDFFEFLDEEE